MSKFYMGSKKFFFLILILSLPAWIIAQAPTVQYTLQMSGLDAPINIANAGDGSHRLFLMQQGGIIFVKNGATVKQFADFGATGANIILYGGERGLLSMAFHPQYDGVTNRYFYIYHNDVNGDVAVSRCQTALGNPDTFDIASITNIITIPHPTNTNHNGGQLRFGPDGYLYFATGDGGGGNDVPNNAQNGDVLLGKMIRIDINNSSPLGNYAVPTDNPYVSDPNIDDRIWALGLRNPYRWSFDKLTGDMWIGDVGQGSREEIDFRPAGSTGHVNYGWRCFEGYPSTPGVADCNPVDYIPPVFDYPNPDSGSAVTGGFVCRSTDIADTALRGRYITTDVYTGYTWLLSPNGNGGFDSTAQAPMASAIVAFGEDEDGRLFAVSQATGGLYRVSGLGGVVLPVGLVNFSGKANQGYNELKWKTATEQSTARFYIEYSINGASFTRAGSVSANRNPSGSEYRFSHFINSKSDILYRLAIEEDNGFLSYSSIIKLSGTSNNGIHVYPTVVTNRLINLEVNGRPINSMKMINTNGMIVFKKDISNVAGTASVTLPALARGTYLLELEGAGISQTEKIVIQ